MKEEKDFFKTCFNTVAGLEVKNESQAIAKEVVLSEIENLQQENNKLQNNWNELKKGLQSLFEFDEGVVSKDYLECAEDTLEKMQELEQVK